MLYSSYQLPVGSKVTILLLSHFYSSTSHSVLKIVNTSGLVKTGKNNLCLSKFGPETFALANEAMPWARVCVNHISIELSG